MKFQTLKINLNQEPIRSAYCKDCKHWIETMCGEGECRDSSKVIYDNNGGRNNEPPVTNPTDTCSNWADRGGLKWHYGPTALDSNRGKMWCYDCGKEVMFIVDGYICVGCSRSSIE